MNCCGHKKNKSVVFEESVLKTSDYYRTCQLPKRFDYPSWFTGYGNQKQPPDHPFYRTTSSDYGR